MSYYVENSREGGEIVTLTITYYITCTNSENNIYLIFLPGSFGPTSPRAVFHTSIRVYFYRQICNISNIASLGSFVRTA